MPPRGPALGTIVGSFKSAVTRRINALRDTPGARVWQRNYWEHIIRNGVGERRSPLHAIRRYIFENPLRWHLDRYNPAAMGTDPRAREIWHLMQQSSSAHHNSRPRPTQQPSNTDHTTHSTRTQEADP